MNYFYLPLLVLALNAIHASVYSNIKQNVLSLLYDGGDQKEDTMPKRRDSIRYFNHKKLLDAEDKKNAQDKAEVVRNVRAHEEDLKKKSRMPPSKFTRSKDKMAKEDFLIDPVLNEVINQDRKPRFGLHTRRSGSDTDSEFDTETSSSSLENYWMDEWEEHWMKKKFEALNSSIPRGDVVNMVAARPWGVACGDPNQHDMPWGSCMLAAECDGEYRIYRGDYFCGRTPYVCCALQANNYDMYQGLDVSFEASSFETESSDKSNDKKSEKKKRDKKKRKRRRDRENRKKKIQKTIRKIVKEIKRILSKAYRNGTAQRKKKTKELKRFIEMMKKQYRKDRKNVVDVHEYELVKIDEKLQAKLNNVRGVNEAFMTNDTFSDIVVNGTVTKEKLQKFLRAHPELSNYFKHRRTGINLKSEIEDQGSISENEPEPEKRKPKVRDYDVEYGMLYY